MKCEIIRKQLDSYADGELDDTSISFTKKHLISCANCQAKLQDIENSKQLLMEISIPKISSSFQPKLQQKISKIKNKQRIQWSLSLAASFILAIILINIPEINGSAEQEISQSALMLTDTLNFEEFNQATQLAEVTLYLECEDVSDGGACTIMEISPQS